MSLITEIAPDFFRISTYVPEANLQFNQFLVRDEQPLLYHTGLRALFPAVREAVASLTDTSGLRYLAFSHFEADECGALNDWLALAPSAEPVCTVVAALVSVNDFALRPARTLVDGEVLSTGKYRFRFLQTPHVPHAWESSLMFEEVCGTLLCSDLLHQDGEVEAVSKSDVVERSRQVLRRYQQGPLANYLPYTPYTERTLLALADLRPNTCATMHGSSFAGDGRSVLRRFAAVLREELGEADNVRPPLAWD